MTAREELLLPTPQGLYCPPGDFHIDPVRPVARAVITHGHADHARSGHDAVLATSETLAIMHVRYGARFAGSCQSLAYGERLNLGNVTLRLVPAGHVLGSAQVVIEQNGIRTVASGDFKRSPDPTCIPFEPVPCDVFITEATFGLPVFRHPPAQEEVGRLLDSLRRFPERPHLVGAYALGKAQRLIALLRAAGYDEPIPLHAALRRLCDLYTELGVELGPLPPVTDFSKQDLKGRIILCPPSALNDHRSRHMGDAMTCFASGWMRVRQRARQRGVELPLIISDHADWDELTATLHELDPSELWVTHGREDALVHYARTRGYRAQPLSLVGYEDEDDGGLPDEAGISE